MTIAQDIQGLEPGALVTLYELDATSLGGTITRFHAGTNGLTGSVVWQGNTYVPLPVEADGFDFSGKGQLPRPRIKVANTGGAMGALAAAYGDLLGAKLTRRRTMAKYLDAANFPARRNILSSTDRLGLSPFWGPVRATVQDNVALAPDGNMAAERLVCDTSGANHYTRTGGLLVDAAANLTGSVYFKADTLPSIELRLYDTATATDGCAAVFRSADATVIGATALGPGTLVGATITRLAGGWHRATITGRPSAGVTNARLQITLVNASNSSTFTDPTASSAVLLWGPQVEQAATATEYQPVAGGTWSANPTADPTAEFPPDVFYVDRKSAENKVLVEWELAAAFDVAGVQLPRRPMTQNVCVWRYRVDDASSACSYAGTSYFDANDNPVGSAGLDVCGKRLSSCRARFGATAALPFGGFPGVGLSR